MDRLDVSFAEILAHRIDDDELELLVRLPLVAEPKWISAESVRQRGMHESVLVDKYLARPENQVEVLFISSLLRSFQNHF